MLITGRAGSIRAGGKRPALTQKASTGQLKPRPWARAARWYQSSRHRSRPGTRPWVGENCEWPRPRQWDKSRKTYAHQDGACERIRTQGGHEGLTRHRRPERTAPTSEYRSRSDRFEVDGANAARSFLGRTISLRDRPIPSALWHQAKV